MPENRTVQKGVLYLIPSSLGGDDVDDIIPRRNKALLNQLDEFIVENLRTARRFMRSAGFTNSFDQVNFHLLNKHTSATELGGFLEQALKGKNIGLLSEAGCPCIADPGQGVVRQAHLLGIRVVPLVGPSSILLALMASGFNGQSFTFHGYLPIQPPDRAKAIRELEKQASLKNQTQIFMETPFRNDQMMEAIVGNCRPETLLCVACDLTKKEEFIKTLPVGAWKKQMPVLHKRTSIFLLFHP
ncbi:MAG: SAM-dependent methyltransferase [Bacteroidales bacterium]